MSYREVINAVLRRWWLLLLPVVIGASAGWLSAPASRPPVPKYYKATQTLIVKPDPTMFTPSNPATIALLATRGEVAARAAATLVDDPAELNGLVEITGEPALAVVRITTRADDAAWAEEIADTFARELAGYLGEQELIERQATIDALRAEGDGLLRQIAELDAQLRGSPADAEVLREQRDVLLRQHNDAIDELVEIESTPAVDEPVVSVGPAVARPIFPTPPRSAAERAAILGFLGLLVGGPLVLVLHRLDVRISSTADARRAFGLPVLAEIPSQRARARRQVAVIDDPGSPVAEAYRMLHATLLLAERGQAGSGHVVVVTSTRPDEGKSTTVANLAAVLADSGQSVLVLGADLRRPTVHTLLGASRSPGITDVLVADGALRLADVVQPSRARRVSVAPAGSPHANPGELALGLPTVLSEARNLADVVLVDAPPLLRLNDAVAMAPQADTVVLVARVRHTTFDAAGRTIELLRRVRSQATGVILIGARETPAFLDEPDDTGSRTPVSPGELVS